MSLICWLLKIQQRIRVVSVRNTLRAHLSSVIFRWHLMNEAREMAQRVKLLAHKCEIRWYISVISAAFIQQEGIRNRRCPRSLRASWPDICSSKRKRICLKIRWNSSPDFRLHAMVLKHTYMYIYYTRVCTHTLKIVSSKGCDTQRCGRIENSKGKTTHVGLAVVGSTFCEPVEREKTREE